MHPELNELIPTRKEVFSTAREFNSSQTGIVVAATAGFLVLSYLVGLIFLVFGAMGVALLLYRILVYFRPKDTLEESLREYDELLTRQTQLHKLELSPDVKERFANYITHRLDLKEMKETKLLEERSTKRTPNRKKLGR